MGFINLIKIFAKIKKANINLCRSFATILYRIFLGKTDLLDFKR